MDETIGGDEGCRVVVHAVISNRLVVKIALIGRKQIGFG